MFHADHFLGSAAGRNVSLRQARGRNVIFIDTSVELTGNVFGQMAALLEDPTVGVVGRWGVVTRDLRSFEDAGATGNVHAVEGYLMAFRREVLREVGLLDEKYRFYRHLDLDFSFAVRSLGYRATIDTALPVRQARTRGVVGDAAAGERPPEQAQLLPVSAEVGRADGPHRRAQVAASPGRRPSGSR